MTPKTFATETRRHRALRGKNYILLCASVSLWLLATFPAAAATHVTATYDIGQNPRIMATVNGQPQYGLVFAQRNKPVTYNSVEYGTTVIYGYLDVNGALNDGAGNLYLDLIPNLGATPADGYYVVTFNIQGQVHAEIWVVPDQATVTAEVCRQAQPPSSTAPALFYQFLQEDGNALPQRQKLNFTGAGVSCLDNAGQLRTDCTFSGGGSGSTPIASATVSGTVKTDQTVSDPVVYLTTSTNSLLAGKADTTHTHAEADVTNLVTDLAAKVPTSRTINTASPLAGGGALSSDLTLSCPTCEITGNKNAAGGYAGLDGSSKISGSQIAEVLSSADLTDFASKSGSGTTILGATITTPTTNQALTWKGSNWINQAQLVTSVFGRAGAVAAQSGDYSAAQVTNAFDVTAANTLTNVAAPGTPAAGKTSVWTDSTDKNFKAKDDAGAVSVTVKPQTCTGSDKVSAISPAGVVTCSTDQTGGAGGGYDTLKADSGTASRTGTEALKVAGTANEVTTSAADGTDDTVTASLAPQLNLSGKEIIGGATPLKFEGATDNNIYVNLVITDPTSTSKNFTLPNADSVAVQPDTGAANNFLTAISALGVISKAQPDFSNLSGSAADGQIPSGITRDTEVNVQGTANEIASSGSGVTPTLSLATQLNLSGKEILGGAVPLRFEGATDNNIYWKFSITDPTVGDKTTTVPNADTVLPQSFTCTNQFATVLSGSTGAFTCTTATLASAQFANQGTTTTLLHGNASGNPSWAGVSLTADAAANQGATTTVLHGNASGQPSFGSVVSGDLNITTTSCTNQFVTAISSGAAGTCSTATLASAQFASQGTTTTLLHGNASGNPSWAGISLANDTAANQGTTTTVLHGNASGQPSFGSVTGSDMTAGTVTSTQLATANKTIAKSIDIFDPTTGDTNKIQFYWPAAVTLQRVACSVDTGTVTIQFDERAEATPNTAGTNALTSSLVCDTDSQTTTSFSDSGQAADVPINLQVTATSGTPTIVRIHVRAGIN